MVLFSRLSCETLQKSNLKPENHSVGEVNHLCIQSTNISDYITLPRNQTIRQCKCMIQFKIGVSIHRASFGSVKAVFFLQKSTLLHIEHVISVA